MPQKHSLMPISELEKRLDSPESLSCGSPENSYVSFKIVEGINEAKQLFKGADFKMLTFFNIFYILF